MEQAQAPSAPAQEAPVEAAPTAELETPTTEENVSHETSEGETPEAPKFKRKVNGKVIEATEDELWKHYGLELSAREKMQQAAEQRKEAEAISQRAQEELDTLAKFLQGIQNEPRVVFDVLSKMGHDGRQIARQMVLEELEYERMSDAEKRAHDLERKAKQLEAQLLERENQEKSQREAQVTKNFVDKVDTTLSEAVKLSGLSPKPKTVARLAEACQTLLEKLPPGEFPEPQKIVDKFLSYMRQDASEIIGEQEPEKLVELGILTDNSIKKLVQWHLNKSKQKLPSFGSSKGASNPSGSKSKKEKIGLNSWFDKL